jgi:hypothetical protein
VKSIRVGSIETEVDTLDLRNGPVGPVTVLVSSKACEVSGTVSDSQTDEDTVESLELHADDKITRDL